MRRAYFTSAKAATRFAYNCRKAGHEATMQAIKFGRMAYNYRVTY